MAKEIFATFDFTFNALHRIKDRLCRVRRKVGTRQHLSLCKKKKKLLQRTGLSSTINCEAKRRKARLLPSCLLCLRL